MALFFYAAGVSFDFSDVFTCCGGVYFKCVAGVFDLVKFLVHHDVADNITGLGIKFDYFC